MHGLVVRRAVPCLGGIGKFAASETGSPSRLLGVQKASLKGFMDVESCAMDPPLSGWPCRGPADRPGRVG